MLVTYNVTNTGSLILKCRIIGTGMLAIPVLAGSASYALSESFGWKFGLYNSFGLDWAGLLPSS